VPAKDYIRAAGDTGALDLPGALREYHALVVPFDQWIVDQVRELRRDMLEDFDRRRAELWIFASGYDRIPKLVRLARQGRRPTAEIARCVRWCVRGCR
jgi:hypothetical protein